MVGKYCTVAQSAAERCTENAKVGGSSPSGAACPANNFLQKCTLFKVLPVGHVPRLQKKSKPKGEDKNWLGKKMSHISPLKEVARG